MKRIFALALVALFCAGCLQEKTLDVATLSEQPTIEPTGDIETETPTATATSVASATATATATATPRPTETPPNCTIFANPESLTGPGDVILVIGFNKMPSDGSVTVNCGAGGGPEQTNARADAKGAVSAFRKCSYPDVSSNTVFTARVGATGGFSCSKEITVRG